jgi:hypothetical protein
MDSRLGFDFSSVRVHEDNRANRATRAFGAEALTLGNHVLLSRRLDSTRSEDRFVLAHELVHVVQSTAPAQVGTPRSRTIAQRQPQGATAPATLAAGQLAGDVASNAAVPLARQRANLPTLFRRVQTVNADFHDPNYCFHPGVPRDSQHPDRTSVVAIMQAEIETPDQCDGEVTLRTSVLQSDWGAASADFESYGGGVSQGLSENLIRDTSQDRVDYEERFGLSDCSANFQRCHLIKYTDSMGTYTFAEAGYRPSLFGGSPGPADTTTAPRLHVEPCAGVTPQMCSS